LLLSLLGLPSLSAKQPCDIDKFWEPIQGFPYVWGGSQVSHKGFDCSGAIHHISKKMGRPIPRTTSVRMYLFFTSSNLHWTEAKCGDLIWFTFTPNRPFGHIGMHSSDNIFWHSGSSTGPTKAKLLPKGYWDKIFESSKAFGGDN